MPRSGNAIVFGANGITGSALVRNLLDYPTPSQFPYIIATSRHAKDQDPELGKGRKIYASIDLLQPAPLIAEALVKQVGREILEGVKYVYLAAYVASGKGDEYDKEANVRIVENAVGAVELAIANSPRSDGLEFIVLQTGCKTYGAAVLGTPVPEWGGKPFSLEGVRLSEDLPPVPAGIAGPVFYYPQVEKLRELSVGKSWRWAEVVPDAILGFVPGGNINAMNAASSLGIYLAVKGEEAKLGLSPDTLQFPGPLSGYLSKRTSASQDILARFQAFVSLLPPETIKGGEKLNITNGDEWSFEETWGRFCKDFGLREGDKPPKHKKPSVAEEMKRPEAKKAWDSLVKKYNLSHPDLFEESPFWFLDGIIGLPYDFVQDIGRARAIGWGPENDKPTAEVFEGVWNAMRERRYIS